MKLTFNIEETAEGVLISIADAVQQGSPLEIQYLDAIIDFEKSSGPQISKHMDAGGHVPAISFGRRNGARQKPR